MSEHAPTHAERDDAPITTSKHIKASRELFSASVTINRQPGEIYALIRDPENIPAQLRNLASVDFSGEMPNWQVAGAGGRSSEWLVRITQEEPDVAISWQSQPESDMTASGKLCLAAVPGRGTAVTATIAYELSGGFVGKLLSTLFQTHPSLTLRRALRRLKQHLETGEIATAARNAALAAEERKLG